MTITSPFTLTGHTALITGSARGLGSEMAHSMAVAGARVIVNGRDPDALVALVAKLRADGLDAVSAAFDVTDLEATRRALDGMGPIDVLVNNVGQRDRRGLNDLPPEGLTRLFHINVTSAYQLSRLIAEDLIAREAPGRIINISSVIGQLGRVGDIAYSVVKAALDGLTRSLAAELGPHRITVNSVAPGPFATETNAGMVNDPAFTQFLTDRTVFGRWGQPSEVAGIVTFLAGESAGFITGQTINVDAGMTMLF